MSTKTATSSTITRPSLTNSHLLQYALGGWIFFIVENVILSENRTAIISYLQHDDGIDIDVHGMQDVPNVDESKYRMVYGTFSTIATISILYGYRQLRLHATKLPSTIMKSHSVPVLITTTAISMISLGLILISQALPKLQIPIELASDSGIIGKEPIAASVPIQPPSSTTTNEAIRSWSLKVRCPFDFTDSKNTLTEENVIGVDRVTRHPGLWAFAFVGLGTALLQPTLSLSLWMTGPFLVALFGGHHHDSRLRRHIGGTFPSATYENQTSNIPFLAMMMGKQKEQNGLHSLSTLLTNELKLLNASLAILIATFYVTMNKGRHTSHAGHMVAGIMKRKTSIAR
jgi:hypothetical protein